jgi:hypothetical protein
METNYFLISCLMLIACIFRIHYTFDRIMEASELVRNYCSDLVKSGRYNIDMNYFKEMIYRYPEYMFSFRWGKYSAIKKEYNDELSSFMK